ncbi:hypothetical protein KPH14_000850 [Odynerus spinipes]|uniref:Uncharacterized protein n=1 Tax=Odynerus spinipes TaxID=1348599 RepID=A0AAD9RDX4_9HYME|nr:hypothetical protein KPH14_000850 [Odynerus spinipes]
MYNKLENILSDEIKWENEPHCYMSNHTEIRLSIPEKNPYIIDYSILFLNGSPLIVFNNEVSITSTQINFFDAENGGKIIYLDNTSSNIYASISNARTYLDVQGSNNFQYKTSEYLDNMITRKNQKQASYDNIDIQRETAEYVKGQNYAYNSTATIADGAAAASGAST